MVHAEIGKVNDNVSAGSAGRVLVIFPGSLGDFLCFLPALKVISKRHRQETVELIGKGEIVGLALGWSLVAATYSIDRYEMAELFSYTKEVSQGTGSFFARFKAVYSWTAYGDPHFVAKLKHLTGGPIVTFPFYRGQDEEHASTYYLRCLREPQRPFPRLNPGAGELQWAEDYWRDQDLGSSPVLALHPGSGSLRKQWDLAGFEEVSRWWMAQRAGKVLAISGPAEEERELRWRKGGCVAQNLSLPFLAALLYKATAYVGNDSGVSHLAGVMGTPGVIVFGPTHPRQWQPLGKRLIILRNQEFRRSFPDAAGISLAEIPAEKVTQALAPIS